jgi:serine/threonine-protein kinase RsbT
VRKVRHTENRAGGQKKNRPSERGAVPPVLGPQLTPSQPAAPSDAVRIAISTDVDIVKARQQGRKLAGDVGFETTDLALVATAISELARNIVRYAKDGEITIRPLTNAAHQGVEIVARDQGPGIKDVEQVMQVGFSTSGGLGLGLPGVRRLMDEFEIQSTPGLGTTIVTRKWRT